MFFFLHWKLTVWTNSRISHGLWTCERVWHCAVKWIAMVERYDVWWNTSHVHVLAEQRTRAGCHLWHSMLAFYINASTRYVLCWREKSFGPDTRISDLCLKVSLVLKNSAIQSLHNGAGVMFVDDVWVLFQNTPNVFRWKGPWSVLYALEIIRVNWTVCSILTTCGI